MTSAAWNGFLEYLQNNQSLYPLLYSLVKQSRLISFEDKKIVLGCDNQGVKFFLDKKIGQIEDAFRAYSTQSVSFELKLELHTKKRATQEPPPLLEFQPTTQDIALRSGLNNKYRFDNFAVSSSNQVGYAASQAVADNLGSAYNPLFLHGGVGVGKTHLAQAVAREILEKDSAKKVFFCPGEQFTNELIESIREKSTGKFRRKYRFLNLLIIDDVQFIAGKQTIQEEFFHTFNFIISSGGQIILTSDRPPAEIKNLEDRLRSRFSGGLVVDIQEPDFELRTAILLNKAKEKNIEIEMDAARIIAEETTDTRALEGTLLSIYAKTLGIKDRVDLEAVELFFSNKQETQVKKITPNDVIKTICSFYNIKQSQIKGPSRIDNIALARQVAMYILRHLGYKLDDVALFLKRKDHTTVIHADEKITRLMATNPNLKREIDQIRSSLNLST